jgi:hypothetical protein
MKLKSNSEQRGNLGEKLHGPSRGFCLIAVQKSGFIGCIAVGKEFASIDKRHLIARCVDVAYFQRMHLERQKTVGRGGDSDLRDRFYENLIDMLAVEAELCYPEQRICPGPAYDQAIKKLSMVISLDAFYTVASGIACVVTWCLKATLRKNIQ